MRRKLFGTRRRVTALLVVVALIAASAAYAGWQVTRASGKGSGKAGQLAAPTVDNAGAVAVGDMFPTGNIDSALRMTINNPNTGTLYIRSVGPLDKTATLGGTPQCDWAQAATRANLLVKTSATNGLSIAVPPGSSQVTVPNLVGLGVNTPTECQGTQIDGIDIVNVLFDTTP